MEFVKKLSINGQVQEVIFNENEYCSIKQYIGSAKRLSEMISRKPNLLKTHLSLRGKVGEAIKYDVELPNIDDRSVLLHLMRPFVLQKESTFLPSICNILNKRIDDEIFREYINQKKNVFNIKKSTQPFYLTVNEDRMVNSDEMLQLWLNAYEYHRDEDKIKEIQEVIALLPFKVF
jgi:hypothetical protein